MGGLLTTAAVAETMTLTGGAAGASASAGATASLGAAGTAIGETLGSLGSYTIAVGTYTITAPVALIAGIGVAIAAMASYAVTRRLRASGASETQSLLRGSRTAPRETAITWCRNGASDRRFGRFATNARRWTKECL